MIKVDDLRSLGPDELEEKANSLKKELMQFRFQLKTGKLEKQTVIHDTKKDIARVLTILNEKKSAPGESAPKVQSSSARLSGGKGKGKK